MPSVVQFGAGAIGRGFLAPLWCAAGYDVVFVELDRALVDMLNRAPTYALRLVDNDHDETQTIGPVCALHPDDTDAVQAALATCAFAATAVGVENVSAIHPPGPLPSPFSSFVGGKEGGEKAVLVCENGNDPAQYLRALVPASVPLYNGIIGRAVPPPTLTSVVAEPYGDLRVSPAFPFTIPGVFSIDHYPAEVTRKLFLHNGGHFYLACLGLAKGYPLLWQAAEDPALVALLEAFWSEVRAALTVAYGLTDLDRYTAELLRRFRNRPLSDPCARIARDPERKLAPGERLLGPRALCEQHGLPTRAIDQAIALASAP